MNYPSISQLEPEQIQAIGMAQEKGSALFRYGNFIYTIMKSETRGFNVIAMDKEGNEVGSVAQNVEMHYALEVKEPFRGQGIGTLLLRTK